MKRLFLVTFLSVIFSVSISQNTFAQSSASSEPVDLSAADFKKMIESEKDIIILDVRTENEFKQGHVKGAINIDWYQRSFSDEVKKLPKDKPLFIYCRSGNRTSKTKFVLTSFGFTKVYNLQRGIIDWVNNKYELIK